MENKKQFTFKDLKEAVNKLSNEQLEKEVFVQREDEVIKILRLDVLDDDIYYNMENPDDRGTLKDLKNIHDDDFIEKDYARGQEKDTPFLIEDF